jgi:hypothetical protein
MKFEDIVVVGLMNPNKQKISRRAERVFNCFSIPGMSEEEMC